MTPSSADAVSRLPNLESIARASVAAVAICYALGLIIKNIHLAFWSTFSASFVEVEYVLIGALFVLLSLLGLSFWSVTSGIQRRVRLRRNRCLYQNGGSARWIARLQTAGVFALAIAIVAVLLSVVSDGVLPPMTYLVAGVAILILPALAILAKEPIGDLWHDVVLRRDVAGQPLMRVFFVAIPLVIALVLYAAFIYPNVSPAYGGGRHALVQLYVSDDEAKTLRDMRFAPEPADPHLFSAELIFEDDHDLTLAAPSRAGDRTAVRVRRDQVKSIVSTIAPRSRHLFSPGL